MNLRASGKWRRLMAVCGVVAILLGWMASRSTRHDSTPSEESGSRNPIEQAAAPASWLEERERRMARNVWAKEMLAQECGQVIEELWDALNSATNKLERAAQFSFDQIILGQWDTPLHLPHEIILWKSAGTGPVLSKAHWRDYLDRWQGAGWELEQIEFRHNRFECDSSGRPKRSRFYFSAHLVSSSGQRAAAEGDLIVDWVAASHPSQTMAVKDIDASQLVLKTRRGQPAFQLVFEDQVLPRENAYFIDPLILHDLDQDKFSEIILASANRLYRRDQQNRFSLEPLCSEVSGPIFTGLIADFDGDGTADFLGEQPEGLRLFSQSKKGRFDQPGRLVWSPPAPMQNLMAMSCGDIDRDGDLDLFLGQYKVPTYGQVLRPAFHSANDSYPAYLLLNDGHGQFHDATAGSGLEAKRGRRVFSASFVDLNADSHLDLMVVSDFAGMDLYRNDGQGRFSDVTSEWSDKPHAFGMAHAISDFDKDGHLDLLMIGMNSPTVDRLEFLGLNRPGPPFVPAMRKEMTRGNRLYFGQKGTSFKETTMSATIARSGWSWGCSAFDFDNDAFPDVYIANGHETKQTVRDYESEFWLHDIYIDDSVEDAAATAYFTGKFPRTRGAGWSYGGYEKNRLYLNREGREFVEIAPLLGVALEKDSRNVVADDLDGDGRMDLLLTTSEVWPEPRQTLRVYRNVLESSGNWIGLRLAEAPGFSPIGAQVAVEWDGRTTMKTVVTGDSFRSQHAPKVHFGLGPAGRVERVKVLTIQGQEWSLENPAVNQYHDLPALPIRPAGG